MKKFLITVAVLATLYFWVDENGLLRFFWVPDTSYYGVPTPPPHLRPPTPSPYPVIVHPYISPAATPRPGTGRPPAI